MSDAPPSLGGPEEPPERAGEPPAPDAEPMLPGAEPPAERSTRDAAREATEAELGVRFSSRLTPQWSHALKSGLLPAVGYWLLVVLLLVFLMPENVREIDVWAAFAPWQLSSPGASLILFLAVLGGGAVALIARQLFFRYTGHLVRVARLAVISVLFSCAAAVGIGRFLDQVVDALVGSQGPLVTLIGIALAAALLQGLLIAALLKSGGASMSALGADMDRSLREKERRRRRFQRQMYLGRAPGVLMVPRLRTQVVEDVMKFARRTGRYTLEAFTNDPHQPPVVVARARRTPDPVRLALAILLALVVTGVFAWWVAPQLGNRLGCPRLPAQLAQAVGCDFALTARPGAERDPVSLIMPGPAAARAQQQAAAGLGGVLANPRQTVIVAVDVSASMQGESLASALSAARRLAQELPVQNRLALVRFAAQAEPVAESAIDRREFQAAVGQTLIVGRGTNLTAALASARDLIAAGSTSGRGAVIVISDGSDTSGRDPVRQAQELGAEGIPVYTIYAGASGRTRAGPRTLQSMAQASGGAFVATTNGRQIEAAVGRLGARTAQAGGTSILDQLRLAPGWRERINDLAARQALTQEDMTLLADEARQVARATWWIDAVQAVLVSLVFALALMLIGLPLLGGLIRPMRVLGAWLLVQGVGILPAALLAYFVIPAHVANFLTWLGVMVLPVMLVVLTALTARQNFAPRRNEDVAPLAAAPRVGDIAELRITDVLVATWVLALGVVGVVLLLQVPWVGIFLAFALFPLAWLRARAGFVAVAVDSDFDGTRVSVVPSGARAVTRRLLRHLSHLGARLPGAHTPDPLAVNDEPQATFRG